jgi:hypothetical protein
MGILIFENSFVILEIFDFGPAVPIGRRLGSPLQHPTGVSVAAYAHPPEREGQC